MDLSIFLTPEAWISLITLIFLEIVLGVDNIVFIAITSERLPKEQKALGRKLGLAGALVSRCIFLCFAAWLVQMTEPFFTLDFFQPQGVPFGVSLRNIILVAGGAYLIYKGISEIVEMMRNPLEHDEEHEGSGGRPRISLGQAIATIMVMDIVFSIDSVITAVGLADHLIIMIIAVMVAVLFMMLFIDWVSDFINKHTEMTILALVFIATIGFLLVFDGLTITTGVEFLDMHLEKCMVYFAMIFAVILQCIQMRYTTRRLTVLNEMKNSDDPELTKKASAIQMQGDVAQTQEDDPVEDR